jgi:predicted nucleic acid-binding protein
MRAVLDGDADYLVSGDRDLLTLESYRSVKIVRPAAFLTVLGRGRPRR